MIVSAGPAGDASPKSFTIHLIVGVSSSLPSTATTDWDLSSPTMSPVSPKVGDQVRFSVILRALSTNRPYPQSVKFTSFLDGKPFGAVW